MHVHAHMQVQVLVHVHLKADSVHRKVLTNLYKYGQTGLL